MRACANNFDSRSLGTKYGVIAEHLLYAASKPGPGRSGPQILTPLQLIDRLAALVPPPRVHRRRYYGVLAPNAPLRPAVTAMALPAATPAPAAPHADQPAHRRAARYAWAVLLARVHEVFPLRCPLCGADRRIIAFITDAATGRDILAHLGEPIAPPRSAPARGPPLGEAADAQQDAPPDPALQPVPADEFDQRLSWESGTRAHRHGASPGRLVPAAANLAGFHQHARAIARSGPWRALQQRACRRNLQASAG